MSNRVWTFSRALGRPGGGVGRSLGFSCRSNSRPKFLIILWNIPTFNRRTYWSYMGSCALHLVCWELIHGSNGRLIDSWWTSLNGITHICINIGWSLLSRTIYSKIVRVKRRVWVTDGSNNTRLCSRRREIVSKHRFFFYFQQRVCTATMTVNAF